MSWVPRHCPWFDGALPVPFDLQLKSSGWPPLGESGKWGGVQLETA